MQLLKFNTFCSISGFFAIVFCLSACNLDNRIQNTKALAEEMNSHKIKRVTSAQISTIVDDWGNRIIKKAQQELSNSLTKNPEQASDLCSLKNLVEIDSLEKKYGVTISLLTSKDIQNQSLSSKERELLDAYLYNSKNNTSLTSNIQNLGNGVMIYNAPVPANLNICKSCAVESNLVVWRIKFQKQEVIKRVDAKSLLKMK